VYRNCPPIAPIRRVDFITKTSPGGAWATGIRGTQLFQRGVPAGGAGVVAVEGTAEIPGHDGGQTETERSKPALPGARPQAETTTEAVAEAARVITKDLSRLLL
jgi:hypothetical protein